MNISTSINSKHASASRFANIAAYSNTSFDNLNNSSNKAFSDFARTQTEFRESGHFQKHLGWRRKSSKSKTEDQNLSLIRMSTVEYDGTHSTSKIYSVIVWKHCLRGLIFVTITFHFRPKSPEKVKQTPKTYTKINFWICFQTHILAQKCTS